MYCPRCGTENKAEGIKFCRNCGEDLRLLLQVLVKPKSWHIVLARQVEEYLVSKRQRNAEAGAAMLFSGVVLLFVAVVNAFTLNWQWGVLGFVAAVAFLFNGTLEWRRYKRELGDYTPDPERVRGDLSVYKNSLPPAAEATAVRGAETRPALEEPDPLPAVPPASVTEHTTKHLSKAPGALKK